MEIKYSERRIRNNLGAGIVWLLVGLYFFYSNALSAFSYVWLIFGAIQIGTAWYIKKHPYISIENNKLTRHYIFPKTIEIDEIRKVRKFVNSYKIETSDKTIEIDKNVMEPESLYRLTDFLNGLELKDFGVQAEN